MVVHHKVNKTTPMKGVHYSNRNLDAFKLIKKDGYGSSCILLVMPTLNKTLFMGREWSHYFEGFDCTKYTYRSLA